MNAPRSTSPVKTMVLGFLALTALALAFGLGARYGAVDATLAQRAIGTVTGAMFVVAGNFLPKMRPLNTPGGDPARTSAAERTAGWILVVAGVANIALFLLARLPMAREISSLIGIAAITVIAANWLWVAGGVLLARRRTDGETPSKHRAPRSAGAS